MNDLADRSVQPYAENAKAPTDAEIKQLLSSLPGWAIIEREGIPRLEKSYKFDDFMGSLAFANQVGEIAEKENHHPAMLISWGRAAVSWWTHEVDGLHENDFILAAKTDLLYGSQYQDK